MHISLAAMIFGINGYRNQRSFRFVSISCACVQRVCLCTYGWQVSECVCGVYFYLILSLAVCCFCVDDRNQYIVVPSFNVNTARVLMLKRTTPTNNNNDNNKTDDTENEQRVNHIFVAIANIDGIQLVLRTA